MGKRIAVVAGVNRVTTAMRRVIDEGWDVILVEDRESPNAGEAEGLHRITVDEQREMDYRVASELPRSHRSRKALGYLRALEMGADVIYDAEGDSVPYVGKLGSPRWISNGSATAASKFGNPYSVIVKGEMLWPRGFPLRRLRHAGSMMRQTGEDLDVGVWQCLLDREPDVDSVYRLVLGREHFFDPFEPFAVQPGTYVPINSRATFWKPELAELMFLPTTAGSGFADILRGWVAQPIMWNRGFSAGYAGSIVRRDGGKRDLMEDFESEVSCHLDTERAVEAIGEAESVRTAYERLASVGVVSRRDASLARMWERDVSDARG
jgi:hypothetical protein